jgi:hypothetical protein
MDMDAFDAWIEYLFEWVPTGQESGQDSAWLAEYGRLDGPVAAAERIRRLFSDSGELLRAYQDEVVGQGLQHVVQEELHALQDKRVPIVLRTTGVRSIGTLFAEVFAKRGNQGSLGHICFMFWDVAPLDLADDTVLDVLEETLKLDSEPCQWAALHGLGHAHMVAPEVVTPIVDRWLRRHRGAPQELRSYAESARIGMVN